MIDNERHFSIGPNSSPVSRTRNGSDFDQGRFFAFQFTIFRMKLYINFRASVVAEFTMCVPE